MTRHCQRPSLILKGLTACILFLLGLDEPLEAGATTLPVSNCNDSGPGSLRANLHAAANGDTVDLTDLSCSKISLTSGELVVDSPNVTIEGDHHRSQAHISIDAQGYSRIFATRTAQPSELKIYRLILENGYVYSPSGSASGGCVYSTSSVFAFQVNAYNCEVQTYSGYARGGAIYADQVDMAFSRLNGNSARCYSGGVANGGAVAAKSLVDVDQSSISGNFAQCRPGGSASAGALWLASGSGALSKSTIAANVSSGDAGGLDIHVPDDGASNFSVLESTVSGNSASGFVGGMRSSGAVFVFDSTIAFNQATSVLRSTGDYNAAGMHIDGSSPIELSSNIIANNFYGASAAGADFSTAKNRPLAALGHNLVQVPLSPVPADTIVHVCPMLAALADNGGWTPTHRLRSRSPAIDHGFADVAESSDQRGFPRPSGTAPDIGAFEVQVGDELFDSGFDGCGT